MNLTIIGTGFVGVVSSAVFASFGNTVVGLDIDPKRIGMLREGRVPFYEPGLEELLKKTQEQGTLSFTDSYEDAIKQADVIFIAVGTPSAADGQADLRYVMSACDSLSPFLKDGAIVAIKSTVPPGTCDVVRKRIQEQTDVSFFCVSLPEFLREGTAVQDTLHPDRVIIGADDEEAITVLSDLHEPLQAPVVVMNPASAQMCKYAANAYLATRITFINQIANLCEANGANVLEVVEGIGYDKRIGSHYWYPGLGYGGSCFPKDVKELAAYAKSVGESGNLMVAIDALNEERIPEKMQQYGEQVDGWKGKTVAVLGLSFKPNTDDMREAPSLKVIPLLLAAGASVRGYDPMAATAATQWFAQMGIAQSADFRIVQKIDDAVRGADVIIHLIEWKELQELDLAQLASLMGSSPVLIDTRDQFDPSQAQEAGFHYIGVGVS